MGRTYDRLDDRLRQWMERQPVFFVATAPLSGSGHVNCSPKGNRQELAVIDAHRLAYLDQTGSGVETIAHLRENGRIVLMFCAFEGPPRIVRVHGRGRVVAVGEDGFAELARYFPLAGGAGVRSIIVVEAQQISDSCGYAVPFMSFASHRATLDEWADRKGRQGVEAYWADKNRTSIDGLPGIDRQPWPVPTEQGEAPYAGPAASAAADGH
jgi:Pyridoxamine 5'-phosphate oxidase